METENHEIKRRSVLTSQQIKRATWELSEEEKQPIFTDSQIGLFKHVDNYDDALAVLDEKNEVKNKLRRS